MDRGRGGWGNFQTQDLVSMHSAECAVLSKQCKKLQAGMRAGCGRLAGRHDGAADDAGV
jgi:hypothetical protein